MAKKARFTTNQKRQAKQGKGSIVEAMTSSAVGTQVYEINDPAERLIQLIGSNYMNEPQYYPTDPSAHEREYQYDETDFDENAQNIINAAMQVARSDNPRDLLAIAHWARKELKVRTTPQVLLAVAAHCPETKEYVRPYCKNVIQRADEIKQVFVASRALFGHSGSLPNSLKRGLADSFQKFGERDFIKYEGKHRPQFGDVLKMVDRAKGYPLRPELAEFLRSGEILDSNATPIAAARKQLSKLKSFGTRAKQLAKKSGATWEVLSSQFGGDAALWEFMIDEGSFGYMAMIRNLRNMVEKGVSEAHLKKVAKRLVDGAVKSKQLPYRFLAAKMAVTGQMQTRGYYGYEQPRTFTEGNTKAEKILCQALDQAVDKVIESLPKIPGKTAFAIDNSGSMDAQVSENSQMSRNMAGCILGSIMYDKSARGSVIGAFGNHWEKLTSAEKMTVLERAEAVGGLSVGHSTNMEDFLSDAIQNKKVFDRMVFVSDEQTYGQNHSNHGGYYGFSYGRRGRAPQEPGSVKDLIAKYRERVNPKCKMHFINLAAKGQSLTPPGDTQTNLISGFSEQLLKMILEFEGLGETVVPDVQESTQEEKQVFPIEYIRENY